MRFGSREEVVRACEEVNGKSCGGRKIQVNLAKTEAEHSSPSLSIGSSSPSKVFETPSSSPRGVKGGVVRSFSQQVSFANIIAGSHSSSPEEAWAIKGEISGVCVASWVVEEGKKDMHCSLIGFLKSSKDGLRRKDQWLNQECGILPVQLNLLDEWTVWMVFTSEEEVKVTHSRTAANPCQSPSSAIEKWMEVLGHPPRPCWVRIRGVPLHIWRESVFKKLEDCLGRTIEVDKSIISQANMQFGRVKIFLEGSRKLPSKLALWWDDLSSLVEVKEEISGLSAGRGAFYKSCGASIAGYEASGEEDDDVSEDLNFKPPSPTNEFELMFLGRSVNLNSISLGSDRGLLEDTPIS